MVGHNHSLCMFVFCIKKKSNMPWSGTCLENTHLRFCRSRRSSVPSRFAMVQDFDRHTLHPESVAFVWPWCRLLSEAVLPQIILKGKALWSFVKKKSPETVQALALLVLLGTGWKQSKEAAFSAGTWADFFQFHHSLPFLTRAKDTWLSMGKTIGKGCFSMHFSHTFQQQRKLGTLSAQTDRLQSTFNLNITSMSFRTLQFDRLEMHSLTVSDESFARKPNSLCKTLVIFILWKPSFTLGCPKSALVALCKALPWRQLLPTVGNAKVRELALPRCYPPPCHPWRCPMAGRCWRHRVRQEGR